MANAQPDGSPGYEPMDWEFSLDDPIFDFLGAAANSELGRVSTSPSLPYTNESHLLHRPAPVERAGNTRSDRDMNHPAAVLPTASHDHRPQSYAAVVRGLPAQARQQTAAALYQPIIEPYKNQAPTSQPHDVPSSTFAGPSRRYTKTYAEALRSPPAALDDWLSSIEPAVASMSQYGGDMRRIFGPIGQDLLPESITNNPNYHSRVTDSADSVQDWAAKSRTARGRLLPSIDTSRLTPFTPSTNRSPASASSSRLSNRRTRRQMMNGNYRNRCHICQAGFETKSDLTHHLRSHTPEEQRPHACFACAKRFLYAKDLKRHLVIHFPKSFFCPHRDCKQRAKGFSRQDHLDRHLSSQHPVDSAVESSRPSSIPDF